MLTIAVVNDRVLDGDAVAAVRIPSISVLGSDTGIPTATSNVDVVEDDIRGVRDEVVVLRGVSKD